MHVRFTQSYAGPAGLFARGLTYDLPPATLAQIPAGHCQHVAAPWDAARRPKTRRRKTKQTKTKQTRSPEDKQVRPGKGTQDYETK